MTREVFLNLAVIVFKNLYLIAILFIMELFKDKTASGRNKVSDADYHFWPYSNALMISNVHFPDLLHSCIIHQLHIYSRHYAYCKIKH